MIISTGLNNHDVINYHTVKFEDKKIEDDQFAKELKYQEDHLQTKDLTKKYNKIMHYLNYEYKQNQQDMDNNILRDNALQDIYEVQNFNKTIQAHVIYRENQKGTKVAFT